MPRDFLEQALIDRVNQGPVKWDMWVTVGQPGDPETDPTVLWPSDRKEFKAGTLTFTATPQQGVECKEINPVVMSDGIAPTRLGEGASLKGANFPSLAAHATRSEPHSLAV